jgi:hypothetical protein
MTEFHVVEGRDIPQTCFSPQSLGVQSQEISCEFRVTRIVTEARSSPNSSTLPYLPIASPEVSAPVEVEDYHILSL